MQELLHLSASLLLYFILVCFLWEGSGYGGRQNSFSPSFIHSIFEYLLKPSSYCALSYKCVIFFNLMAILLVCMRWWWWCLFQHWRKPNNLKTSASLLGSHVQGVKAHLDLGHRNCQSCPLSQLPPFAAFQNRVDQLTSLRSRKERQISFYCSKIRRKFRLV